MEPLQQAVAQYEDNLSALEAEVEDKGREVERLLARASPGGRLSMERERREDSDQPSAASQMNSLQRLHEVLKKETRDMERDSEKVRLWLWLWL